MTTKVILLHLIKKKYILVLGRFSMRGEITFFETKQGISDSKHAVN